MYFRTTILPIILITSTTALNITYPLAGDSIPNNAPLTVRWTTSSTDPPKLDFILINANGTFAPKTIGTNISTSDLKLQISIDGLLGNDFRITVNSIGSEGNDFVAQSAEFDIDRNTTSSSSATTTSTAAAAPSSGAAATMRGSGGNGELLAAVAVGVVAFLA